MYSVVSINRLISETGAYKRVPSKSQNSTVVAQGDPSSTQCSNSSWTCHWHMMVSFGTNNYSPFRHSTKNQVFIPIHIDFFYFLNKMPTCHMYNEYTILNISRLNFSPYHPKITYATWLIFDCARAKTARKSWDLLHMIYWVTPEIYIWRTSISP